jgi:tetratricopeptide (TPR) repeat protein
MRVAQSLLALMTATVLSSCATMPQNPSSLKNNAVTSSMVLDASPLATGVESKDLSQLNMLEMTPEMMAFVDSYVGDAQNRYARMKRLVYAVMGEGNFELIYDDKTRTAQETFRDARGNCLSFTNMFIAMARYVDIHAEYQEVDIPPDWSLVGQSFLFSQHVNVLVDLGVGERRIVDFNVYDFNVMYDRRVISDARARAHYFSNIGVDHMLNGDTAQAYANFRQALLEDSTFSPAWINMGVLHRRESYPAYAEAAYEQALEIDQFNLNAMSNLANLYDEEGLVELAEFYSEKVEKHRMNNPYYRYHLAQSAVIDGDYNAAIEHLDFAISEREEESRFYFLMSLSYLMSGDKDKADTWMAKAEELAGDDADKQHYQSKMDRLFMSQGLNNQR